MDNLPLTDRAKRSIMMLADTVILAFALWAAVVLRYGELYKDVTGFWWLFPSTAVLGVLSFRKFGLYRAIVRYIGPSSMLPVIQGISIATVGASLIAWLTGAAAFPRSAPLIFWFIAIFLIGGSRLLLRAYFYGLFNNYLTREPVAIYGAGESGAQLAVTLLNGNEFMPVAFFDDDRSKRKSTIHGIRVYDAANIDRLVSDLGIRQILLAVPSATAQQRKSILSRLAELPVHIKTIPGFNDLISGSAQVAEIREVDIGDLLGREPVPPDDELLAASVRGKSVMVTGAGGTIGSELCRKILEQKPARLVLFDSSEIALYHLEADLKEMDTNGADVRIILGTVLNQAHVDHVMAGFHVQTVYHAAAYKHVHIVERNMIEGVRNNVLGTWYTAQVAAANKVEVFVLISTDKAVRPTNVMGASKRLAELIVQAANEHYPDTRFCMVRFGNVLKSSGSVVPLFEKQIREGGPVTVTHKDATRYFMTRSEAAELVIQAGALAEGGEVFVLDMGELVSIQHLAEQMIHLHGKKVSTDVIEQSPGDEVIEIVHIGLRPGEKLFEELIIGENVTGTRHPKIMKADEDSKNWREIDSLCRLIEESCQDANFPLVRKMLEENIVDYQAGAGSREGGQFAKGEPRQAGNITIFPGRSPETGS